MQTKAAVLSQVDTPFQVETLDLADPRAGELLVRIEAAGVCHSDWHLVTGDTRHPLPAVAGHEGAGVVEAVGDGIDDLGPGDRVMLNWAPACGDCYYCSLGRPNLCERYVGVVWDGCLLDGTPRLSRDGRPVYHYCSLACFAEYAVVARASCVPLPDGVPFEVGGLIGCCVSTGVGSVLNTAAVPAGASVAVFGVGGVGLATVMGARLAGAATIIAIDPREHRRCVSREIGATHDLPADPDPTDPIRALTEGRGVDFAFDTTGLPPVQERCLDAVRPGGVVVLSGLAPMGSTTNFPASILTRQEKTVRGSYYGTSVPARDFRRYAELFLDGKLPIDRLVSRRYRLDQVNDAFADMLAGTVARGVILPGA